MKILYLASSFHAYIHYPIVKMEEEFQIDYFAYFFRDKIFYFRSKTHREHWKPEGYTVKIDPNKYKIIDHYPLPRNILKWTVPYIMYYLIRKEIKKGGYDLIHAHATDPNGLLARIVSKKLKIPYIISEHGPSWYFYPPDDKKRQKVINKYSDVFCHAHTTIAVSEHFAHSLKSYWPNANITVNHNAYNNAIFVPPNPEDNPLDSSTINLITVGTFNANKNQILLLKAINILKDTYPHLHLNMIGRGDITSIYQKYIAENNLEKYVSIKDFVPHHELVKEYHKSHIFILTSQKETFGIVLLEAMACSVAVITSKTDGAATLIQDDVNGLLFENNIVEDLCTKIKILIENPEKRMNLVEQGLQTAREYCYKYREIYDIYMDITPPLPPSVRGDTGGSEPPPSVRGDTGGSIDLVYLWVDGNDPKWQERRRQCNPPETSETARFQDNDELKYSLRSIEKYAPWINKIYIITDDQVPHWLDTTHPKIKIVDHTQIVPNEYLPCFNSNVLEIFLYKIPDLSEHFLYANDDMFLGRDTYPSDFFVCKDFPPPAPPINVGGDDSPPINVGGDDSHPINVGGDDSPHIYGFPQDSPNIYGGGRGGLSIIRSFSLLKIMKFYTIELLNRKNKSPYFHFLHNAQKLVKQKYHKRFLFLPHHCIDGYLKSEFQKNIEQRFLPHFRQMAKNRFRSHTDIQRILHNLVALAEKKGQLRYVRESESFPLLLQNEKKYKKLMKKKPLQFCLNDTELASNNDRMYMNKFLQNYFPEKSSFER